MPGQPAAPSRLSDAGSHPVTCPLLENVGRTRASERITNWTGVTFPALTEHNCHGDFRAIEIRLSARGIKGHRDLDVLSYPRGSLSKNAANSRQLSIANESPAGKKRGCRRLLEKLPKDLSPKFNLQRMIRGKSYIQNADGSPLADAVENSHHNN